MSKKKQHLPTESVEEFGSNPFGELSCNGLISLSSESIEGKKAKSTISKEEKLGRGERLEVRREKSGRGGKTVTTVRGFPSYFAGGIWTVVKGLNHDWEPAEVGVI